MKPLITNTEGSSVPLLLVILTIVVCGALYTLFFIEIALPTLSDFIPSSNAKTFVLMCIYAIPLFVTIMGIISLLIAGVKRTVDYYPPPGVIR